MKRIIKTLLLGSLLPAAIGGYTLLRSPAPAEACGACAYLSESYQDCSQAESGICSLQYAGPGTGREYSCFERRGCHRRRF